MGQMPAIGAMVIFLNLCFPTFGRGSPGKFCASRDGSVILCPSVRHFWKT